MRSIGRLFQPPEAVAGTDVATAETDPDVRERERMSQDGRWWWDGERWLAACTPDGLWQWDGEAWRPLKITAETRCQPHETDDLQILQRLYLGMALDQATAIRGIDR